MGRPPTAEPRLSVDGDALVVLELKRAFCDGTTHVLFEPEDFIARLAARVPRPRAHLLRYHGRFAPRARLVGHYPHPGTSIRPHAATSPQGIRPVLRCQRGLAPQYDYPPPTIQMAACTRRSITRRQGRNVIAITFSSYWSGRRDAARQQPCA